MLLGIKKNRVNSINNNGNDDNDDNDDNGNIVLLLDWLLILIVLFNGLLWLYNINSIMDYYLYNMTIINIFLKYKQYYNIIFNF